MRFLLVTLLAAAVACGETGTSPGASSAGDYALRSIDSRNLPIVATDSTLVSAVLTLADSGAWKQLTVVKYPQKTTNDTLVDAGTWTGVGSNFTFLSGNASQFYVGTKSGGTFTLTSGSSTFVFSR